MQLVWDEDTLLVVREKGDKRFYGSGWGSAESAFLHSVKQRLLTDGYDVIKKRAWKDGNIVDEHMQWIRSRNAKCKGNFAIYNPNYAVFDAGQRWNEDGKVELRILRNLWGEV